jgi:hypothetical protein
LIAAGSAAAARGADDEGTPVSVLIGDAVAEYEAGHYQEARALFRQAHEKVPTARTLRGIGMASFELRDYVEAVRALTASLRDQRRPLTAEQKRHAEALLARAHTFVGRFTMKLKPAGSSLFVDGHPADLEPDNVLLLPFGRHQLSLRCASCSPAEKDLEVDVSGGERRDVELALAPAAAPGAIDTSGSTVANGTTLGGGTGASGGTVTHPGGGDTTADKSSAHLWLAGLAGAAALGAGGTALWWREQEKELDRCQAAIDSGGTCMGDEQANDRRKIAIGATIGLGAVAVISAAFSAVLWSRPDKTDSTTTSNVACAIGKDSVSCAFRF